MNQELTERQARILDLVIHDFIGSAAPVASGGLLQQHDLGVSAATVRKELAILEDLGLLSQPHTSAGRVPTALGYRYFVEHLMRRARLSEAQQRTIRHQFHQAGGDLERWLRLSAAVMAHTSGAAGLVATDREDHAPRLYHAGLTQILYEPEFAEDIDSLRIVIEILEHGTGLDLIGSALPHHGVEVIIGGEPPAEGLPEVTLVLARFGHEAPQAGILGVVGPTRLPYERAVPAVGFVASLMTELLTTPAA